MDCDSSFSSSLDGSGHAHRREFLKRLAIVAGSSTLLAELPWWSPLRAAPVGDSPADRVRIGIIGVGTRGNLHISHLLRTPGVEIAALCDDYEPHLQAGLARVKGAKGFADYRQMLDMPGLDGVLIASPLYLHARMCLDAFSAGKHVFCEKSLAYTIEECQAIANAHRGSKKVFQIGHQRMFSPVFLRALELVRNGEIGQITQIRAYWHRNGNWRNAVPDPSLEHRLNWRLYRAYSCGLMTELASHHMQVANWFLGTHPVSCAGYGSINYWKDGREVYDNVNVVYRYADNTHVVYDSLISNRFYGLEIQIMGPKGTIEAEAGRLYAENPPPAPGIVPADQRNRARILRHGSHRRAKLGARPQARHQGTLSSPRQAHRRRNSDIAGRLRQRDPIGRAHSRHDGTGVQSRRMRPDGTGLYGTTKGDRLAGGI